MKKIMLFAAACVALVACSKEIDESATVNATAFEEGQKVVLTVGTNDQTKVSSALNATTGAVDFKWETGDKIKVTVNSQSAEFTLKSGAGEATATFEGTMPAAGNTFDVQYPVTDPDLTSQTYVANALPKDKLKMAATGCTIADGFTLTPQNAALRLNLYGLNREVSQIVVTDKTANPNVSYTLTCSNAVRVGNSAETATPFLLVVPGGASWIFNVEVTAGNATANPDPVPSYTEGSYTGDAIIVTSGTFTTSSAQTFTAGQILNMPAKLISSVWAPVNCGYDATHPQGLLYQWSRKYGQPSNTTPQTITTQAANIAEGNTDTNKDKFYTGNSCWFSNSSVSDNWDQTSYNPCPSGWRVPTADEFGNLYYSDWNTSTKTGSTQRAYSWNSTKKEGTINGLTLPATGYRSIHGVVGDLNLNGYYWSSSPSSDSANKAYRFDIFSNKVGMYINHRADGYAVRCIHE